jgi:L-fucose isomerase-like protein
MPRLQDLLRYICKNGFEHHTAMNPSSVAAALDEAFTNYLGLETYWHQPPA